MQREYAKHRESGLKENTRMGEKRGTCASSRYRPKVNQYTQLMKKKMVTMNSVPLPLHYFTKADFVWLHWFENLAGKITTPIAVHFLKRCTKKGLKIIWNVHNKIPHETTDLYQVKYLMKQLAEMSYKIVIHSKITTQMLEGLCENDESVFGKIVFVSHPHYIGAYGEQVNDNSLDNVVLKLGFFGAVKKYKNVELLITAVIELGFDDIELNIYGLCTPKRYMKALKQLVAGNPNVKLHLKFIPDNDIPKVMASCHLFVLPYNLDSSLNSGATILAFSYGRTVLSPNTGTLLDIEDKSLFFAYDYVDHENHKEELKEQITAIRAKYYGNYNGLLQVGESCKQYVSEKHSDEVVMKQLEQCFEL